MIKRRAALALILVLCLIITGTPQAIFGLSDIEFASIQTTDSELQTVVKHDNNTKKDKHPLQLVGANNTRTYPFGNNVKGDYDPINKTLTISGKGEITDIANKSAWEDAKSITINEGVISICANAFSGLRNLTSVKMPNSVTSIGDRAFYHCLGLNSITFPNSVFSIGNNAFEESGLQSVNFTKSVNSIGDNAFYQCRYLTSVTIPEGVNSIGNYAFYRCENLNSITIPKGVTSIGNSTFDNCSRLNFVKLPKNVTKIGDRAFYNCYGLTDIVIPSGATSIGDSAFGNCSKLKSITIPEGVTSIGSSAFFDCNLTSVKIPSSVMKIGGNAFYRNSNLATIENLCNKQQSVADSAFRQAGDRKALKTASAYSVNTNFIKMVEYERYNVKILDITGIKVTAPTKGSYLKGEHLNLAGGVVTIKYGNGTSKKITLTSEMVTGYNPNIVGNQRLIVKSNGFTDFFNVTVVNKSLSSIAITTAPAKTVYIEGENFDDRGMIVTATYTDGSTAVVNGTITNGTNLINGTTAITVSYTINGITKTVTQPITILANELTSINITTAPTKTEYVEGQNFETSGMIVTATYNNGKTAAVNGTIVDGSNLTLQSNNVTISYTENGITKTTIQQITVTTKKLSSLEILTAPTKTNYIEGQNFDSTGMVVTAIYNDGTKRIVTGTVINGDKLVDGTNSIIISYTEDGITKTTTLPINVIAKRLISIEITTAPSKIEYMEGENFDTTGMIVTANYNDGSKKIVTGTVINGNKLIAGTNNVTISYMEDGITKTAIQSIGILHKTLSSIEITKAPSKTKYIEGEEFDATGMIVTAIYTDGSTAVVNGTIHSTSALKKEAIAVNVSYTLNGITKTTIQPITVIAKELISIQITTLPVKTEYIEGEDFDTTGMVITATYNNGKTVIVNGTVENGNNLNVGTSDVTISYIENGIIKTTTQKLTVIGKKLISIAITKVPIKTIYRDGENFDSTGMVVTATYSNGKTAIVNGMVEHGNNLTIERNSVTISYIENDVNKSTNQAITIIPASDEVTTIFPLGDNITGKFDAKTGVLTVSGNGAMAQFESIAKSPVYNIRESIKYIVVENGVTTIGSNAFGYCRNLTTVSIPNSVTVIEYCAFQGDVSLSSISLGKSITEIGGSAFYNCKSINSINLPNTLEKIGRVSFYGCTSLTNLQLPNSLITIDKNAFNDSGLSSITLPNSVKYIDKECFRDCSNLKSIVLSSGMRLIPEKAFYNCESLTSVTIPEGVSVLGESAFERCKNLSSIILPGTITVLEKECFCDCSRLNSITNLSKKRQKITNDAFSRIYKGSASGTTYNIFFKKAVLDAGYTWTEIMQDEVVYTLGPSVIGKTDKEGTLTVSGTGDMTNFTSSYPVFYKNISIKKIIITEGITNIGDYVFSDISSNISLVVIPDSVTKINQYAFYNTCIDSIVIGKSVKTIDDKVFYGCKIKSITNLYKGNQSIYPGAFYHSASTIKPEALMYQENTNFKTNVGAEGFGISYLTDDYLKSLAVTSAPTKTVYMEGENFDSTGMVVTVTYSNGATAIVNGTVTNGENLVEGANSVTISYSENGFTKTTTQPITVISKVLKSIAITTVPTKIVYVEGDDFDDAGMIVTATYSDGSTVSVKGIIANGTLLKKGTTGITISYTKNGITKSITQPITVIAKELDSIAITTAPTKTDYIEGQNFDATGMVVTATYNNGKTAIVNGTIDNGNNLTVGRDSVTISYNDKGITKTTMIPIKVSAKKLSSISVTTAPTKTQYNEGERFDATGMVITAIYNNGTSCSVTGAAIDAIDGAYLMPEANSVTISYTEGGITKTVAQSISVKHKSINKQFSFDCIQGKDLFVPFRVMDTRNLKGTIFTLKYETASLDLIDLVSQTKAIETTAGIVSGTDIEILSYTPGEIKFKVDKDITNGKTWSGTVNIFKFKAKVTEKTGFTAEYN